MQTQSVSTHPVRTFPASYLVIDQSRTNDHDEYLLKARFLQQVLFNMCSLAHMLKGVSKSHASCLHMQADMIGRKWHVECHWLQTPDGKEAVIHHVSHSPTKQQSQRKTSKDKYECADPIDIAYMSYPHPKQTVHDKGPRAQPSASCVLLNSTYTQRTSHSRRSCSQARRPDWARQARQQCRLAPGTQLTITHTSPTHACDAHWTLSPIPTRPTLATHPDIMQAP